MITRSTDRLPPVQTWARLLVLGAAVLCFASAQPASGGAGPGSTERAAGQAQAGKAVFNGKGVCFYCHGVDGRRDRLPRIEADTAALIAQLNPPPTDLRVPSRLRLKTDRERTSAIRNGHPGTGMFPDTRITDQELADTLAYLAVLRQEGTPTP